MTILQQPPKDAFPILQWQTQLVDPINEPENELLPDTESWNFQPLELQEISVSLQSN